MQSQTQLAQAESEGPCREKSERWTKPEEHRILSAQSDTRSNNGNLLCDDALRY
jgi:hypothetical protein